MNMHIKKILVPIDCADDNQNMYHYALDLARVTGAEIILFHVFGLSRNEINDRTRLNEVGVWSLDLLEEFQNDNTPEALSDISISLVTEPGLTANSILKMIRDEAIDLVVMGTHGDQKAVEAYFGSTTLRLINEAVIPILVVPEDVPHHPIDHILYTINFEFRELKVVRQLLDLALILHAKLTCLHVLEDNENLNDIQENMDILSSIFRDNALLRERISFDLRVGPLKTTIAQYANREGIDLVATRLKNPGWKVRTLDSVSGKLIRKIDKPILVWKDNRRRG